MWRGFYALSALMLYLKPLVLHLINGSVAEWLGRGLQNLLQRFESARYLTTIAHPTMGYFCSSDFDLIPK